jgi:two-component system phosphate regulon sensor histidine kinase PhoR
MRHQVDKALEMTILERQDLGLTAEPIDIPDLLHRAAEPHLGRVEQLGGHIEIETVGDVPGIEGDEIHLFNVFSNLFDNAIRYNRRAPEIRARTAAAGRGVAVIVEDNGIGLAPGEAKRVFDRYYRVSGGNVQETGGFGLGLSYVRRIVRAHGGSVTVRSEAGEGSVFEVRLPCRMKGRGKR